MSNKEPHTSSSFWGSDRVHDSGCKNIGWVDSNGDVHPTGDIGTLFSDPETIGHVNDNGSVTITGKK